LIFRALFLWALGLGLKDAISRRPDLGIRLAIVEAKQIKRVWKTGTHEYIQAYLDDSLNPIAWIMKEGKI
jgi:hypothetical protein